MNRGDNGLGDNEDRFCPASALVYCHQSLLPSGAVPGVGINSAQPFGSYGGAVNGEMKFNVLLAAGVYRFSLTGVKSNSSGKISFYFDGTEIISSLDLYASSTLFNQIFTVSKVPVAFSGNHIFESKAVEKNPSSSSYDLFMTYFVMSRYE